VRPDFFSTTLFLFSPLYLSCYLSLRKRFISPLLVGVYALSLRYLSMYTLYLSATCRYTLYLSATCRCIRIISPPLVGVYALSLRYLSVYTLYLSVICLCIQLICLLPQFVQCAPFRGVWRPLLPCTFLPKRYVITTC
jgi:uncharacterized membrane protein (Fun14 family)